MGILPAFFIWFGEPANLDLCTYKYVLHKLIINFVHFLFWISRRSERSVSATVSITFIFSFIIGNENLWKKETKEEVNEVHRP